MNREHRERVVNRQEGRCWWCDRLLRGAYAVHHRRLRKQGGTDCLANLLALCHGCHNGDRFSVHLAPATAYHRGFLVRSWADPAETPVLRRDGSQVLLRPDGTATTHKERHDVW